MDDVLVTQSCPTLCDPMDCSMPGSSVHGILQAILEWVAIPFSRGSSWLRNWIQVSCIAGRLFTVWATREALTWMIGIIDRCVCVFCVCVCVWLYCLGVDCVWILYLMKRRQKENWHVSLKIRSFIKTFITASQEWKNSDNEATI